MNTRILVMAVAAILLLTAPLPAQVPQIINYQGRVAVGTPPVNFEGTGQFRFALVNAAGTTTFWSNDNTSVAGSQPTAAVPLTVTKGLYSVLLGDTTLAGMTAIPNSVFANPDVRLRVWFNDGTNGSQLLTPDQRMAAVGYAMIAGNVPDGAITSAKIATGAVTNTQLAAGAVSANSAGTIVLRDGAGSFSAGTIVAFGAFNMPSTTGAGNGLITQNDIPLLHTFGTQNFFVGQAAGNFTMTGGFNTASGFATFQNNTTGSSNAASGYAALQNNTTGSGNTASGFLTLYLNTSGDQNTAVGQEALRSNTTGFLNTASGYQALYSNTTGIGNTASGYQALFSNTEGGTYNTASGYQALYSNTMGYYNTASGLNALYSNTTGHENTASGSLALQANTTGSNNTASGYGALSHNTTGADNTASGYQTLNLNTTGSSNTASGYKALYSNNGDDNIAIGYEALYNNTDGAANTGCGFGALKSNTTGIRNTASGYAALSNSTGDDNTALGYAALFSNTTGSNNTAIGTNADVSTGTLGNATAIGYDAQVNASNKVRIGNTAVSVIEGQVAYTFTSDRNAKENFLPVDGAEVLRKIRGFPLTSWNYIGTDEKPIRHYGVMAQDFYEAFGQDALGTIGTPTTVNSGDMAGVLMSAVQALDKENAALREEAATARKRLAELEVRLKKLEQLNPEIPKAGAATAALKKGE